MNSNYNNYKKKNLKDLKFYEVYTQLCLVYIVHFQTLCAPSFVPVFDMTLFM